MFDFSITDEQRSIVQVTRAFSDKRPPRWKGR
jgi:hypothetical protein